MCAGVCHGFPTIAIPGTCGEGLVRVWTTATARASLRRVLGHATATVQDLLLLHGKQNFGRNDTQDQNLKRDSSTCRLWSFGNTKVDENHNATYY